MNFKLTADENSLHSKAVDLCRRYRRLEWELIQVLQQIDGCQLYKQLGYSSCFQYAVGALGLTESVAYAFISVSRKAQKVSPLREALKDQSISVNRASRLISVLNEDNAKELIEFGKTHSAREVDQEMARLNPKAAKAERAKPISEDLVSLSFSVSREVYEKLKRAQNLASQKKSLGRDAQQNEGSSLNLGGTLEIVLDEYLKRFDPVQKAKRALQRETVKKEKNSGSSSNSSSIVKSQIQGSDHPELLCTYRVGVPSEVGKIENTDHVDEKDGMKRDPNPERHLISRHNLSSATPDHQMRQGEAPGLRKKRRVPPKAGQKHVVFARGGACCTFKDTSGKRCTNERWLHVHHIIPVSQGGSNDPSNLTTLCSYHHDLVHQLSFPIEEQVSWLRSPHKKYLKSPGINYSM